MSPEMFAEHVSRFCQWAESNSHDLETVHQLLLLLMEGAGPLKTSRPIFTEPVPLGLPQEVVWRDTKHFADFPFQCYYPVLWRGETHPEGPFTDNIHEDFAHIYAELHHGLQALDRGGEASAIKYWRDSYFLHWGHHASAAVWAIEEHLKAMRNSEPAASPNGGPAQPLGNSAAGGGPPSVS
jgi:hypothetical protein